jgi:hypothetical protein
MDADLFLEDEGSGIGDLERSGSGARDDRDDEDSILKNNPYDSKSRNTNSHNSPDLTFLDTKHERDGSSGGSDNRIPPDSTPFSPKHGSTAPFFKQPGILAGKSLEKVLCR